MPHVIARSRPSAYMKWVVMKYIDNLIGWGDSLFRQDTIESINQATQLYVLAGHILGPRPEVIPRRGKIQPLPRQPKLQNQYVAFSPPVTSKVPAYAATSIRATEGLGSVGLQRINEFSPRSRNQRPSIQGPETGLSRLGNQSVRKARVPPRTRCC